MQGHNIHHKYILVVILESEFINSDSSIELGIKIQKIIKAAWPQGILSLVDLVCSLSKPVKPCLFKEILWKQCYYS